MRINYKAKLNVHVRRGLLLACGWVLRRTRDQVAGVPRRLFRKLFNEATPPLSAALKSGLYKGLCSQNLQSQKEMETTCLEQWFPFAEKYQDTA